MSEVFGRKYSLIFGKPEFREVPTFDLQLPTPEEQLGPNASLDFQVNSNGKFTAPILKVKLKETVTPADFKEITDHQIIAVIPQTLTKEATGRDKGYIEIYNLSEDTINFLQESTLVFLKAGYEQDVELDYLFVGEIQVVSTERRGLDIVTTIICGQKLRAGRDVRVQKTYEGGLTFHAILKDLLNIASENGIPLGQLRLPPNVVPYDTQGEDEVYYLNSPLPVSGYILDVISRVATMAGCRSYMVLGRLYVEPIAATRMGERITINRDNVQEGIKRTKSTKMDDSNSTDNDEILVKLFLNPRINPSAHLTVTFGELTGIRGDYKINKVEHLLDFEGNSWTTEVTATKVDNNARHEHNSTGNAQTDGT